MLLVVAGAYCLAGCSDRHDSDVVALSEQSDDIRHVVFDKDGVVEIRQGGDLVFSLASANDSRLPASPMLDTSGRVVAAEVKSDGQVVQPEPESGPETLVQPPRVLPQPAPAKLETESLVIETRSKLEPLPPKVAPLVPNTTYAVQVGFFGQRRNAENLRDVLTNNDWPVKLVSIVKNSGKTFYLVVVPIRGARERAKTAKLTIKRQHGLDGIVIRMDSLPN